MSQFIKDTFQKRSTKIFTICKVKLNIKKYNVSITAITKLMPANLSILIIIKFIKANNKVFKKLGSSHFLITLCIPWELLYLTSKDFLFVYMFPCLFVWKKIKMVHGYSFLRYLSSNNPET